MVDAKKLTETVIGIVIAVAVFPIAQTAINDANFTGTVGTLMNLVPTLLAVAVLIATLLFAFKK